MGKNQRNTLNELQVLWAKFAWAILEQIVIGGELYESVGVVHPQKLMKHPWRTSDIVLVVRHGCSIHFCGCMTEKWVL